MDLNSSDSDSEPEDTGTLALVPRPCATPCAASALPRKAPIAVASTPTALPPGWKRCNNSSKRYRGPGGLTSSSVAAAFQLAGAAQFSTPGSRVPDDAPRKRLEKRPLPPRSLPSAEGAMISEEEAASLPLLEQWRLNDQGSCEGRVHGRSGYRPGSLMETSEVVATARVTTAARGSLAEESDAEGCNSSRPQPLTDRVIIHGLPQIFPRVRGWGLSVLLQIPSTKV